MDHMDHTMSMSMSMSSTGTATAPTSTGTSMDMDMDMGGMSHDMGGSCQVSMLWNWNTIDACFLSSSWHITSKSMFAGSCIGVIVLVMSLEFLRRLGREYDAFIIRRARLRGKYPDLDGGGGYTSFESGASRDLGVGPATVQTTESCCSPPDENINTNINTNNTTNTGKTKQSSLPPLPLRPAPASSGSGRKFRPSPIEQTVRALLHMVQFAVAYFVMLLAMYFNGYIIICIFIGAFLGSMVFSWEVIGGGDGGNRSENDATAVTKCCG